MSKYINLIDKLTKEDKDTIIAYIDNYGCKEKDFIGLDAWLQNWSHSNQKLYHLLGDSFIREFPYTYTKSRDIVKQEIRELLIFSPLKEAYHDFYWEYIKEQDELDDNAKNFFNHLLDLDNFVDEKICYPLKIKKPNAKKMLQIQVGTKPIKAIGRVIEYFKDEAKDFNLDEEKLDNFRKKYSIILSERVVKGKYCISIHPMDFMTMSDNASNWTSCMSWKGDGCYHIGTVEMMNSNNVVCGYLLTGDNKFIFDGDRINPETGEVIGVWNNKRWRQLFYITKDIVMGGKPYPYSSKELTIEILGKLKELAGDNLNWSYQFGPELYQDMIHIGYSSQMETQRAWMRYEKKNPVKHNIIWDTKGMYNDMLNDHHTEYWCYRNKVNHTKIISTSGKAPCLCCGKQVLSINYDAEDYNDRYEETGSTVCYSCLEEYYHCACCEKRDSRTEMVQLKNGQRICKSCISRMRICPCCGEIFYLQYPSELDTFGASEYSYNIFKDKDKDSYDHKSVLYRFLYTLDYTPEELDEELAKEIEYDDKRKCYPLERLYIHQECRHKIVPLFKQNCVSLFSKRMWSHSSDEVHIVDPAIVEPYRVRNLAIPDLDDVLVSDSKPAT